LGTPRRVFVADNKVVDRLTVECLRCGESRAFTACRWRCVEAGVCPRCQYVGWAYSGDLSERMRKVFRELPPEQRLRLRAV